MRRLLLAALIAALGVLLLPVPAQAGGPTSLLVTNHSLGRATALLYTDARYGELERLLRDTTPAEEPAYDSDRNSLTVGWLLHDVEVWRTDSVVLDAAGGPLVATRSTLGTPGEAESTWGRVNDAAALKKLLSDLGVIGKAKPGATAADPAVDPAAAPVPGVADALATEPAATAAAPRLALTGWRWAVPGLLAGLLLGLAVLPARRLVSRRSGPPVERHQLIDLPGH